MAIAAAADLPAFTAVLSRIDEVKSQPARREELVAFLDERHPCYAGRGSGDAERLRGFLLASFAASGLPPAALPYVIEESESGLDPYCVAGAARALRGAASPPPETLALLVTAIERIKPNDRRVSFERYDTTSSPADPTTALMEMLRTLAWLAPLATGAEPPLKDWLGEPPGAFSQGVRAEMAAALQAVAQAPAAQTRSCCAARAETVEPPELSAAGPDLWSLPMQDQAGARLALGDALLGKPAVLAFFYTRCMNPEKCSLTIVKLARLQQRLAAAGRQGQVNIAAVTYDPKFDVPKRMHTYGKDRGLIFGENARLLRTQGDLDPLIAGFDLGVGYGPVTVNRHRLDLMIFDKQGKAVMTQRRRSWDPEAIFKAVTGLLS